MKQNVKKIFRRKSIKIDFLSFTFLFLVSSFSLVSLSLYVHTEKESNQTN